MIAPRRLAPGAVIGILGGGQLGRMLVLAAARLGFSCHIYCPEASPPAARVAMAHHMAGWDDDVALDRFADSVDVVTYEFENIPVAAVQRLEQRVIVAPSSAVLAITQDRLYEKRFIESCDLDVAPYTPLSAMMDCDAVLDRTGGVPVVIKQRRWGYDGKGQQWVRSREALAAVLTTRDDGYIAEGCVDFVREFSAIAARGWEGSTVCYTIGENHHKNGILSETRVPARISAEIDRRARAAIVDLMGRLDYIGVLAVEFFETAEPPFLRINEMAPRVHNSGHWTESGCDVDQFEQHIRAISGWPLGSPTRRADCLMINLLGDEADAWASLAAQADTRLHLYGKDQARPGRKMGHINRLYPCGGAEWSTP